MTPLIQYIEEEHKGNKAAFARSFDLIPQRVTQMMKSKKKYFVIDSKIIQVCYEKKDENK